MNEREMFEKSFERPSNYLELSGEEQWMIDKKLGILDWNGEGLDEEDMKRLKAHYKNSHCCNKMKYYINMKCKQHTNIFECPDNVIVYTKEKTYGIIIHDGGSSYYVIFFCPWCGKKLKG